MTVRHLLSAADLSRDEAVAILDDADRFRSALLGRDVKKLPTLRGRTIITMFYENSTRTRVSFEVAGKWMSADVINVSSSGSSAAKGESLRDTALTLRAAGADALIIRHPSSGAAQQLAEWTLEDDGSGPSVINAGDGTHEHPTQALLDAFTMQERIGSLEGKNIVIVGDILHSRVALSNIFGLQKLGANVAVSGPSTLIPRAIHELGVEVIPHVDDALAWADVANVLRVQHERMDRAFFPSIREYHNRYGITMDRLKRLEKIPLIMHPGPINRGVELTSEVADSPHAAILNQVENGVAVRMAVLYLLAAQSTTTDVV